MFVIIRSGGNQHYYSTDGVNILNGPIQSFSISATSGIAWSPQLGIFSISVNDTKRIATSTDGLNWVAQNTPTLSDSMLQIVWISQLGLFVGVLSGGTGNRIAWSYDGINYTRGVTPSDNSYVGCTYSSELGVFTSIANGSVATRVMTSSLSGRHPTSYNTFNSSYNNIDSNGNWQVKARNLYTDTGSTITVSNPIGNGLQQTINSGSTYASTQGYYALDKQKQPIAQPLVNGGRAVSTWNYQTSATNNNWQSVCWCPELFLQSPVLQVV
jgi:hypothetical protein